MCMAVQLYTQSEQSVLYALVGYEDGTVAVWDVIAGRFVKSSQLHAEPVMAVAVADDGSGISPPKCVSVHVEPAHLLSLALRL